MPSPFRQFLLPALGLAVAVSGCKPPATEKTAVPPALGENPLARQLASARIDAAKSKTPGEALALLGLALVADPSNEEARGAAEKLLTETTWNWPTLSVQHHQAIDQIEFSPPSSLWTSLSGLANITVLWNLETFKVESVLFPIPGGDKTRALVFDSNHRRVVIQRGGVTLLCDARTLKPICDLGDLPDYFTPSSIIAFSTDGLLIAHPAYVSAKDDSVVWHLKDAASGEIIRSSEPSPPEAPPALAAFLDRRGLRVLQSDGSLMEMPVSPVEPIQRIPASTPMELLHAQFSVDGNSALTSQDQGPHQPPTLAKISFGQDEDQSLTPQALAERFPWSRQPNIWSDLLRDPKDRLLDVQDQQLKLQNRSHAPVQTSSKITASAVAGDQLLVGEDNGKFTIHRLLPLPSKTDSTSAPTLSTDANSLQAMQELTEALGGCRFDESERVFKQLDPDQRSKALDQCDLDAVRRIFPNLDFAPLVAAIRSMPHRAAAPDALLPLWDRLALADHTEKSWPNILSLSKYLADTQWHQNLTGLVVGRAAGKRGEPSATLEKVFADADEAAVLSAIQSAGPNGPGAAKALELALASEHPEWIGASLATATDLPPLLLRIAKSRIAWLQGRKADALASWPDQFPTMTEFRLREDWEGWEQADFSPALEAVRKCVADELLALAVPENSTPEQRKAVADRLKDPVTVAAIGKPRFANACLQAALAFSAFKEDKETTFQLASIARQLGAPAEPCLRAEALALTALGDYKEAHPRWITLITEHPVETHLPGDYAEAAYTAFENANPGQAMEILTTGIHRFPNDGNFAIRAGWVALLTGNSERAYRFLQSGQRVGFPTEKLENATALLAIAAAQSGATDDAAVYFKDLVKISPDWADPSTVETLDWPEELKATLRQLTW